MRTKKTNITERGAVPRLPALPCACANIRRAARVVTQLYERELRGTGMGVGQFTLLQALSHAGEVPQRRLGEMLAIDSTTLTRTLFHLRKQGWIAVRAGADRRERLISVTAAGSRNIKLGLPHWERAQERLRRILGDRRWEELGDLMHKVVKSAKGA
jgi:DNA-binding MarR family transcriptional regulator